MKMEHCEQDYSVSDLLSFDQSSGSKVERLFFNHRAVVVLVCALLTLVLGWQAAAHL